MTIIDRINIYINSKKKNISETNSDFTVSFPSAAIKCNDNQYLTLKVIQFTMLNNFYAVQSANNKYEIFVSNLDNSQQESFYYEIPIGNYSVYDLLKIFNNQAGSWVDVEYNPFLNKYTFTNNRHDDKFIFIKSITANDFLGLPNNVLILLPFEEVVYSHSPINLRGDEMVTLQIPNLTYTNANLSNFGAVQNNSIVCTLPINVPPFALMRYESTDDTFNFRLQNTEINSLRFICKNQDLENIDVGDYTLSLEIQIHEKNNFDNRLQKIERLLSDIFLSQWEKKKN